MTIEQINSIKGLLYMSAIEIHQKAIASLSDSFYSDTKIELALKATDMIIKIHNQLSDNNITELKIIPESLFKNNCVKILNYFSGKGGTAFRYEILSSHILPSSREYDKCLKALIDNGFITEQQTTRKKNTTYSIVTDTKTSLSEITLNEVDNDNGD